MQTRGDWYCRVIGAELGPMSWDDIVGLVQRKNLGGNDLVREGEQGSWVAADSIPGLFAQEAETSQELEFDLAPDVTGSDQ